MKVESKAGHCSHRNLVVGNTIQAEESTLCRAMAAIVAHLELAFVVWFWKPVRIILESVTLWVHDVCAWDKT